MESNGDVRGLRLKSGVSFFSYTVQPYSWRLLVVFLCLIYVPFLGSRVVRPAGDDKVYVSQAIEMAERGAWFVQTYGGEPSYYKGPLHYVLLRVGMWVWPDSMWATVYMNFILIILGALALGAVVHRNMREFEGWSFWTAFAFATCAGIYAHMFASQMEVELASLYAIGMYFLDRSGPGKADFKFWIIAGIAGWLKSPLHSVLFGATALVFWTSQREIIPRVKAPLAWLAALTGVAVCAAGYAPAYFLDGKNFYDTYIMRETLLKPPNGAPWHYPVIPLFTFSLLPWTLPAIVAYFDGITRLWRRQRPVQKSPGAKRMIWLGLSVVIPSVLFFIWHPYRGQNYNLPVVGGLLLLIAALWATRAESWNSFYSGALALTALVLLAVPVALTVMVQRYNPMPFWWPGWQLPVLWIGALLTARGFWREGITFGMARPASLARRALWFLLALGTLLTTIGEREMIDVRDFIYTAQKNSEKPVFSYYNLKRDIWSEWGYLNHMIPYRVRGVFTEEQLIAAVARGDTVLVPGDQWLDDMRPRVEKAFPGAEWKVEPWRRWKTKGKNAQGIPAWQDSWDSRDLARLEKSFYIVQVRPKK